MPIRKSSISGGSTPSGTTADRPSNPSIGDTFFNGTLGVQEIYTSSGWLPATGANDFNVVITGEDTSVILNKEYFSGAYTITSSLNDTSFDLYLFDTQGASAGYTKSPSVNATNNFNKVVVLGGTAGDLLSFSYKTTFTTSAITDEVTTGPIIKSISVADLPNIDDTTVITGINFAEDVEVTFTGTNTVALPAKSVVRSSATSLIVTRPDELIQDYSPYTITVTNPGVTPPTGTNGHISTNAITAGGDPVWVTASGSLTSATAGQAYSATVEATDPDGGVITYSIASGLLPAGLGLNSATGEISGTPTAASDSFIISATDSGGNVINRSFSIAVALASGGVVSQSNGYVYHTFTSNGNFDVASPISSAEVMVIAGGASGGAGGGGGAGGFRVVAGPIAESKVITIGAGGTGSGSGQGGPGIDSSFGSISASGGGGGGGDGQGGADGGSGGGGGTVASGSSPAGSGNIGAYSPSEGNAGGIQVSGLSFGGGGGGAGAVGANSISGGNGGAGTDAYSTWASITSTGESGYYAGGGGGGGRSGTGRFAPGGLGGGGAGTSTSGGTGGSGSPNTGGGGGAGPGYSGYGTFGSGGSGLVIVRYPA